MEKLKLLNLIFASVVCILLYSEKTIIIHTENIANQLVKDLIVIRITYYTQHCR